VKQRPKTGLPEARTSFPINLKDLELLCDKSKQMIDPLAKGTSPPIDYSSKEKAFGIVDEGYTNLPRIYHQIFLDPLKNFIQAKDYAEILRVVDRNGDGPWNDFLASINQRTTGFQKLATDAFEELVTDLYDGFLAMEEQKRIKSPDEETPPPLVVWGHPRGGPYTWPTGVMHEVTGMKMSVVNMPPLYSQNISLWSSVGHETGGHDILNAYHGMLEELNNKVYEKLREHQGLKGIVEDNGRERSIATYGAEYWSYTIDETASDVCGLLNIGPAAGISLANLLISREDIVNGEKKLANIVPSKREDGSNERHPIDALRIYLAGDVIRSIQELDIHTANRWGDTFESIADKYVKDKSGFYLVSENNVDVKMPYREFRETIKIVAETIANDSLTSLGNYALSDVNTWANDDETITTDITNNFLDNKEPSIDKSTTNQTVYAAHIIAGATIALAKGADISKTTELAISSLNRLKERNPVWGGLTVRYKSSMEKHYFIPSFGPRSSSLSTNLVKKAYNKLGRVKRPRQKKEKR
jgi:hypothetical protein